VAWGILGQSVTAVAAAALGSFSSTTYPSNLAIVRASRVGSRWVTVTTGIVMIVGGSILKFDAIFVSIPSNVIAASAIILFGVLAMSAIESLSRVSWDQLNFLVLGPAFMIAIGGLFIAPATLAHFPLIVRQVLAQPLLDGPVLLGSDYPFPLGDPSPAETVRSAGLGATATAAVLGGNASRLFPAAARSPRA